MLTPVDRIRFWAAAASLPLKLTKEFYAQLLGHARVIGAEDGMPVYSLLLPSLAGSAWRNSTLKVVLGAMRATQVPALLSIALTDRCDCSCRSCYFRQHLKQEPILSAAEITRVVGEGIEMGCCTLILVGGEPLLRDDIVSVVGSIDTTRIATLLFTNGEHLAARAPELAGAGLRRVMVSVNSASAARHDKLSGRQGLFGKAIEGLRAAKREGMLTGMSSTVPREAFDTELDSMVELGAKCRVNELMLNVPIDPTRPRPETGDNLAVLDRIASIRARKRVRFGIVYYPHFSSYRGYGCAAGSTRLYVSPYGDVTPCDCLPESFGNIRTEPLHAIWGRMSRHFGGVSMEGCRGMAGGDNTTRAVATPREQGGAR